MNTQLGILTILLYAASLGFYISFLYVNKRSVGLAATLCLAAGVAAHYFALLERSRWVHSVPYQDLYGAMSLFGWLLGVAYLGLELLHRQRSAGAFVLPFILVLFVFSSLASGATPPAAPPARGPLFAFHVTLNILAYAAFTLAFVLSVIYLLQNHFLRDRTIGPVFWRFPALDLLERMARSSVIVGMSTLAVGMSLGFMWAHRIRGHYWNDDPKEIFTVIVFLCYALYLWLGRKTAWRGARASVLCVACFILPIFSFTVVNHLSRYHRFF